MIDIEKLKELKELQDAGIISEDDFKLAKEKLFSEDSNEKPSSKVSTDSIKSMVDKAKNSSLAKSSKDFIDNSAKKVSDITTESKEKISSSKIINSTNGDKKGNKKIAIIGIVIVLLLIIVGLFSCGGGDKMTKTGEKFADNSMVSVSQLSDGSVYKIVVWDDTDHEIIGDVLSSLGLSYDQVADACKLNGGDTWIGSDAYSSCDIGEYHIVVDVSFTSSLNTYTITKIDE